MSSTLWVVFADAPPHYRLWSRPFGRRKLALVLHRLTRCGSPMHCAVTINGVVLDPQINGDRFWPATAYILRYPGLTEVFRVPAPCSVNLDTVADLRPKNILPSLLRRLTFGLWPAPRDCVQTVRRVLSRAGIPTPNLTTPRQLRDWLAAQRFHRESMV